jgi:hypothetical protein
MGNKASAPTSKEDFHVIQQEARMGGEQDYKGVKERVKTRLGRRLSKLEKNLISDNLKNKTRISVANVTNVLPYKPNSAANAAGAGQAPMLGNVGRDLFREQLVHDREILMQFYEATGGASWKDNTGWGAAPKLKDWFGVEAVQGRVTGLSLSDNNVCGKLPEALGGLTGLREVDLSSNALTGPIPDTFSHLHSMNSLWLNGNQLSGPITPALRECMQLISLDLSGNRLQWGGLPDAFFSLVLLRELYLMRCPLADDSEQGLPAQLCHCRMLEELSVAGCGLSGALPASLGACLPALSYLDVTGNSLGGSALPALRPLCRVRTLRLQGSDWEDVSPEQAQALAADVGLLAGM